ncbi:MAG: acetylxylan esterase [Ruminococcaceae bacterium]|nr:acetylxylan esterase [Oscillospiraceae bacterium]
MSDALKRREMLPLLQEEVSWEERRKELLRILSEYEYGFTPQAPERVEAKVFYEDKNAYAGKVLEQHVELSFQTPGGEYRFPIKLFLPYCDKKLPVLLHLAFRPEVPDRYVPAEEICDRGYALAVVCYQDITPDTHFGDFSSGLAAMYIKNNERKPNEWGKIGMWAFGASRVIDYLVTREELDEKEISVMGHSRLGKTALWCGAQDERVYCSISNNSGYGGASLAKGRNEKGEHISDFVRIGSYDWYCPRFTEFNGRDDEKPYDQHFLLSLIAPRFLCVGSAIEDKGADPNSEFLGCVAASEAYQKYGLSGLVSDGIFPELGTTLSEGEIGYHIRSGRHFLSRYDWNQYMDFLDKKRK